jgi:hypothetical protein
MIRFLLRLLGFLILAGGFVALVIDGTRSIAAGAAAFTPAATSWAAASAETLESARAFVADLGSPIAADAFSGLLSLPTFAVLGGIGVLLMLLGRRPRRTVGVVP